MDLRSSQVHCKSPDLRYYANMSLPKIITKAVQKLDLDRMKELQVALGKWIKQAEKRARKNKKTYRLEYVRCGKKECWCEGAPTGHGPYLYCYERIDGKLRKKYLGKPDSAKNKKLLLKVGVRSLHC